MIPMKYFHLIDRIVRKRQACGDPLRMAIKRLRPSILLLFGFIITLTFVGCHSATEHMLETNFSIEGEPYQWEGMTLHNGKILCIDGQKFLLPEEVNEMHGSAWSADLNADGTPDYLFCLASTGNGIYFGSQKRFFFVSSPQGYQMTQMVSYDGDVSRRGKHWIAERIQPSADRKSWLSNYFLFTTDGKMETFSP